MKKGYTLIEVLVVVVIIGITISMFAFGYWTYNAVRGVEAPSIVSLVAPEYAKAQALDRMAVAQEEQNRILKKQLENNKIDE